MIQISIPGDPRGKGRHRSRIASNAAGKAFVMQYPDTETVQYENLVKLCASQAMAGRTPLQGPLRVEMVVTFVPPLSWSNKKRIRAMQGLEYPTGKGDVDNLEKSVWDGCNKIVWDDDRQICDAHIVKRYAESPGVVMTVYAMVQADLLSAAA